MLLTDGDTTLREDDLLEQANLLKATARSDLLFGNTEYEITFMFNSSLIICGGSFRVRVIAVGITDSIDLSELQTIATSDDFIIQVASFDTLRESLEDLTSQTCTIRESSSFA